MNTFTNICTNTFTHIYTNTFTSILYEHTHLHEQLYEASSLVYVSLSRRHSKGVCNGVLMLSHGPCTGRVTIAQMGSPTLNKQVKVGKI